MVLPERKLTAHTLVSRCAGLPRFHPQYYISATIVLVAAIVCEMVCIVHSPSFFLELCGHQSAYSRRGRGTPTKHPSHLKPTSSEHGKLNCFPSTAAALLSLRVAPFATPIQYRAIRNAALLCALITHIFLARSIPDCLVYSNMRILYLQKKGGVLAYALRLIRCTAKRIDSAELCSAPATHASQRSVWQRWMCTCTGELLGIVQ